MAHGARGPCCAPRDASPNPMGSSWGTGVQVLSRRALAIAAAVAGGGICITAGLLLATRRPPSMFCRRVLFGEAENVTYDLRHRWLFFDLDRNVILAVEAHNDEARTQIHEPTAHGGLNLRLFDGRAWVIEPTENALLVGQSSGRLIRCDLPPGFVRLAIARMGLDELPLGTPTDCVQSMIEVLQAQERSREELTTVLDEMRRSASSQPETGPSSQPGTTGERQGSR